MRGGVAGFHGCGLKGEFFFGCGLKGEFFLLSCSIVFIGSQIFTKVPIYDIFK
jgi:hypothetical protein